MHDLGQVQGSMTGSGLDFLICLLKGTEQGCDFSSTWEGKMMPEIERFMPQITLEGSNVLPLLLAGMHPVPYVGVGWSKY